jgi:hypothetical protein
MDTPEVTMLGYWEMEHEMEINIFEINMLYTME